MSKWWKKAIPVMLMGSMMAGCSFGSGGNETNTESTLKVMYYDEGQFYQEFGMLYSALNPNVNIEVVSTQSLYRGYDQTEEGEEFDYEKAFADFIESEKPDILMLQMTEYEKMAQDGKLLDMETYMTRDKYDIEGLIPGMVDYMKELGGGQLYGLPTAFSSQVMYYNKSLFEKYNIPYPTDQMTWDEVIALAKQFPVDGEPEDRVYGLRAGYSGDLYEMSQMLASAEGLNFVNPKAKQMTINTDGWKRVVETAYDAINSDALYYESRMDRGVSAMSMDDYYMQNPFLAGRLAMTFEHTYMMRQIEEAQEYSRNKDLIISDWDIVTMPVSTQYPDQSPNVWYNNIFAISKDSTNVDAAWNFISYITGDEFARVKSKANTYYGNFPVRTNYIKDEAGHNFAAFYKLKPTRQQTDYRDFEKLPPQFSMMFYDMMRTEFQAIQDGSKSVSEALELLQVKGEELLAQEPMTDEEIMEIQQKQMEEERKRMMEAAGEVMTEVAE